MYQAVDYLRELQAENSDSEEESENVCHNLFMEPPDVDYDSAGDDANENVGGVEPGQLHFNQFNQMIELELPVIEGES
jgi:hypothetical protein